MKTISFYSYKGGVGRTLLAAHVARYLAGLGKKVVLVDFDFDAPGVPAIFGLNAFKDIRGGILDLVLEFRAASRPSPQFRRRLNQYLIPPKFKIPTLSQKARQGWAPHYP